MMCRVKTSLGRQVGRSTITTRRRDAMLHTFDEGDKLGGQIRGCSAHRLDLLDSLQRRMVLLRTSLGFLHLL